MLIYGRVIKAQTGGDFWKSRGRPGGSRICRKLARFVGKFAGIFFFLGSSFGGGGQRERDKSVQD